MSELDSKPVVSVDDARALAEVAGVYDPETIDSLLHWLEKEVSGARSIPDIADKLKGNKVAARKELRPLVAVAQEFARLIHHAPHAVDYIRMLYAEEITDVPTENILEEGQRRLDLDIKSLSRLAAVIAATDTSIDSEEYAGPALLGPRKVAHELAAKYVEISYQPFHYDVPDVENVGNMNIWTHPHTSPGTRFVAMALKTMFPTLNDTNLKRILKELPQFTYRRSTRP